MVLNPIRAKLVELPEQWQWSSYQHTAGRDEPPEYLTESWILGFFDTNRFAAQEQYRKFIRDGISSKLPSPLKDLEAQVLLGDAEFLFRFKALLQEKEGIKEIPRNQRYASRPGLEKIFRESLNQSKTIRDEKIYEASVTYGYTLKEISDFLGIHYTTVSKVVREIDLLNDPLALHDRMIREGG